MNYNAPSTLVEQLAQKLGDITGQFPLLVPEAVLAVLFLVLLIAELLPLKQKATWLPAITVTGLGLCGYLVMATGGADPEPGSLVPMLASGGALHITRLLFDLAGILAVFSGIFFRAKGHVAPYRPGGEYYTLLVASVLGLHLMALSANLLMAYLAIETVSLCAYLLTAFSLDKKGAEAGIKYLIFGAMASAIMLYGMSLLYGLSGGLSFAHLTSYFHNPASGTILGNLALFMTLAGFLFKVSAVPFHIWSPDAYQGAPLPYAAFLSVAPKIAGVVMLFHLAGFGSVALQVPNPMSQVLALLAAASIVAGTLAALRQSEARRLMAYSSIAQGGFLMLLPLVTGPSALPAFLFYATVYVCMNFAAFGFIAYVASAIGSERIEAMQGMGKTDPFIGVLVLVTMVSLTGLPATAGFNAKLFAFSAVWETYAQSGATYLLAALVVALLSAAVALFFYLRIPFQLFFRNSAPLAAPPAPLSLAGKLLLLALNLPLLVFFFKPEWLLAWLSA
jgi:NADH-quinone oxidoreductase subunit N